MYFYGSINKNHNEYRHSISLFTVKFLWNLIIWWDDNLKLCWMMIKLILILKWLQLIITWIRVICCQQHAWVTWFMITKIRFESWKEKKTELIVVFMAVWSVIWSFSSLWITQTLKVIFSESLWENQFSLLLFLKSLNQVKQKLNK